MASDRMEHWKRLKASYEKAKAKGQEAYAQELKAQLDYWTAYLGGYALPEPEDRTVVCPDCGAFNIGAGGSHDPACSWYDEGA